MTRGTAPGTGTGSAWTPLIIAAPVAVTIAGAYAALRIGHAWEGTGSEIPAHPITALLWVMRGRLLWPTASTVVAVSLAITSIAIVATAVAVWRPRRRTPLDRKARLMADGNELVGVTGKQARDRALRLRPDLSGGRRIDDREVGVVIGRLVRGGQRVFMSWEDMLLAIAGPRMGKTAALGVGAICAAPGPALVTSNKRDAYDLTYSVRVTSGRAWRYDLQGIAGSDEPEFWWNPLRQVKSIVTARRLASYFAGASREESARVDAYFDGGAQDLLAGMIFAAAIGGGDLLHVYGWLADEDNELPAQILLRRGQGIAAGQLQATRGLNHRQRDGLYGMARRFVGLLEEERYARSVIPPRRAALNLEGFRDSPIGSMTDLSHQLTELVVDDFVASTDTLYALSKEGPDSSAALTTALMGSLIDAGQRRARQSPTGRLSVPLLGVLDEAANVCRLPELPAWYSHLGSQGICLITILQNLPQAQRVWGNDGTKQLLDAANFVWYGGGVKDRETLNDLSALIGDHDVERWTSSNDGGLPFFTSRNSRSQSWTREPILPIDDLGALPKDRAVVTISGNRPVLISKEYWTEGPYADDINAAAGCRQKPAAASDFMTSGAVTGDHP